MDNDVMDSMLLQSVAHNSKYQENSRVQDIAHITLNTDTLINDFELLLRGEVWDSQLKSYVKVHEPIANEKGINAIMKMLRFKVNKLIPLSNMQDDKDIQYASKKFHKEVINLFRVNYKKFGIERNDLSLTLNYVTDLFDFQIRRSYKDGERQLLMQTTMRHEHVVDRPDNKPGFLKGLVTRQVGGPV